MSRPRLATVWLGGCSGCHMSFLDLDEWLLELGRAGRRRLQPAGRRQGVSRGRGRRAGRGGGRQRGGPGTRSSTIRERTKILVSFGDCAVTGNVTGMRNPLGRRCRCSSAAYLENGHRQPPASRRQVVPALLPTGRCRSTRSCRSTLPARLPAVGRPHLRHAQRAAGRGACRTDRAHRPVRRLTRRPGRWPDEIVIDPVTRIEGHAKITIHLDDAGQVTDAQFHVTEFRGFEKFCEGRPFCEMPRSWPASAASARSATCSPRPRPATDPGRPIPPAAAEAAPADEPGPDRPVARAQLLPPVVARPAARHGHRPGQAQPLRPDRGQPELARDGIRLRQFGQEIIELLGGKRIHPAWSVPGGVGAPLDRRDARPDPRPACPRPAPTTERALGWFKALARALRRGGAASSATSRRCSWAWSAPTATVEHYDGTPPLRRTPTGTIVADGLDPDALPGVHRRGGRALVVPEVALLQAARLPRRHLPRRPAGPAERLPTSMGTPLADEELERVPRPARPHVPAARSTTTTPG